MAVTLKNLHLQQGGFTLTADIKITPNQTTAIIGPSGGGKSTLLLVIAGFIQPDRGKIIFQNTDITHIEPAARPLTMLFQENNLFPHLTVFQNTALGIDPNLKLSKPDRQNVTTALERVGLESHIHDLPATLSGGQRQRVAIARALLRKRPLLLLDEPFAALGPGLRDEMLDLVESIRSSQNATLLLVTHSPEDAKRIAKQTILVFDGKVSNPTDTIRLFNNPPQELAEYLGTSAGSHPT